MIVRNSAFNRGPQNLFACGLYLEGGNTMKHAMRKYLTVLLCAALLPGVFCPAAAAGKPAELAASGDLAGMASDPAKTIYATSEETTLVTTPLCPK